MSKTPRDTSGDVFLLSDFADEDGVKYAIAVVERMHTLHNELPPETPIQLLISCSGGYADQGGAIQSMVGMIRRDGRKVNGHVLGCAQSYGFNILQECDHRTAEALALLMAHECQSVSDGSTSARKIAVEFEEKLNLLDFEHWASRTGKPVDYYRERCAGRNWYLTAREALAEGLLDAVLPPKPFRKKAR